MSSSLTISCQLSNTLKFNPPRCNYSNSPRILYIHPRFYSNMFRFLYFMHSYIYITIPDSAMLAFELQRRASPSSTRSPYMHMLSFEKVPLITSKSVMNCINPKVLLLKELSGYPMCLSPSTRCSKPGESIFP